MSSSLEDVRLAGPNAACDPDVFAELVRTYQPALFGHALRRLHDRAAAEDAVQETFVRAYRAMPRIDAGCHMGPWLHRIMANVCIDEANRRRREAEKLDRVSSQPDAVAQVPDVEVQLGFEFDEAPVRRALGSLSPSYREALALRFVHELDYDEMAEVAGVSEANARARVSRARTAMRVALRGVAVMPVMVAGLLRRSERVAVAMQAEAVRVGTAATTTGSASASAAVTNAASGTASGIAPAASALAPMVEAAQTAVATAPQAMPLITKAVIGLGMAAAVAVPTAGPAVVNRAPTSVAPAAVTVPAAPLTPTTTTPATTTTTGAAEAPVSPVLPLSDSASAVAPSSTDVTATSSPASTSTTAMVTTTTARASTSTSAPATTSASSPTTVAVAPTTTPADGPPTSAPGTSTTAPPEPLVPAKANASMSASGLTVTPAGPRVDLSGPVTLTVAGAATSGQLSGRLALGEPDATGRQRVDAVMTLSVGGTSLDLRLAGQATAVEAEAGAVVGRAVSLSGPFRAAGNTLSLVESGTATGTLDLEAGTFSLSLKG